MKKTIGKLLIFVMLLQLTVTAFAETFFDYNTAVDDNKIVETADFATLDKVYAIFEIKLPKEYEQYLINESYLNIDKAGVKRINVKMCDENKLKMLKQLLDMGSYTEYEPNGWTSLQSVSISVISTENSGNGLLVNFGKDNSIAVSKTGNAYNTYYKTDNFSKIIDNVIKLSIDQYNDEVTKGERSIPIQTYNNKPQIECEISSTYYTAEFEIPYDSNYKGSWIDGFTNEGNLKFKFQIVDLKYNGSLKKAKTLEIRGDKKTELYSTGPNISNGLCSKLVVERGLKNYSGSEIAATVVDFTLYKNYKIQGAVLKLKANNENYAVTAQNYTDNFKDYQPFIYDGKIVYDYKPKAPSISKNDKYSYPKNPNISMLNLKFKMRLDNSHKETYLYEIFGENEINVDLEINKDKLFKVFKTATLISGDTKKIYLANPLRMSKTDYAPFYDFHLSLDEETANEVKYTNAKRGFTVDINYTGTTLNGLNIFVTENYNNLTFKFEPGRKSEQSCELMTYRVIGHPIGNELHIDSGSITITGDKTLLNPNNTFTEPDSSSPVEIINENDGTKTYVYADGTTSKEERDEEDKVKEETPSEDTKTEKNEPDSTLKSKADKLNDLKLLKGTEKGYELEKTLTRAEAAAMLVRLLGKENEVLKGEYKTIFEDVPDRNWAKNYVMYCYENGIIKGVGENKFMPDEIISVDQYVTLVLRALGYTQTEPETALKEASERGLLTEYEAESYKSLRRYFNRYDMVNISYNALKTDTAEKITLAEKLIEQNVFTEEQAENAGIK